MQNKARQKHSKKEKFIHVYDVAALYFLYYLVLQNVIYEFQMNTQFIE